MNTASTAGVRGGFGPHAYTAAKHAVVGLTESAAVELMPAGVRVNAIAPGATVSGMTASVVTGDPTALGQVEERLATRFGRAARPEDVAAAAVFLASDEAWYVNGACLVIYAASEVPGAKARRRCSAAWRSGAPCCSRTTLWWSAHTAMWTTCAGRCSLWPRIRPRSVKYST